MNKKSLECGCVAGMSASFALLINDLVLFGNLNLNTASIVMLVSVFILSFIGFVLPSKSNKAT